MGANHARVLANLPSIELVAVVDADLSRAQALAEISGARAFQSVEEMREEIEVDAASVAVPTSLHAEVGASLLRNGTHVLMEKPITGTSSEAEILIEAVREGGALLAVGHVERYNPAIRALRKLVSLGDLGQITSIVARRAGLAPRQGAGTNVLLDLAIHDVDIISFLLEAEPTEAFASHGGAVFPNHLDHGELFLKYGEVGCFVQANWLTPFKLRTLEVTGTRAYARVDYIEQELRLARRLDDVQTRLAQRGGTAPTSQLELVHVERTEPLREELQAFCDFIAGKASPIVTAREAQAALRIIERALTAKVVMYA